MSVPSPSLRDPCTDRRPSRRFLRTSRCGSSRRVEVLDVLDARNFPSGRTRQSRRAGAQHRAAAAPPTSLDHGKISLSFGVKKRDSCCRCRACRRSRRAPGRDRSTRIAVHSASETLGERPAAIRRFEPPRTFEHVDEMRSDFIRRARTGRPLAASPKERGAMKIAGEGRDRLAYALTPWRNFSRATYH